MSRKARRRPDPLEREIEAALAPDHFVSDRGCFDFCSDLAEVERDVAALVDTAPARAVELYETFLAGCYEKAEEVDDSSGSFGMLVDELFCGWIRARQAAGADPEETAARLLAWMDDDPYGFCYRLEQDAVAVLDKAGRAAFTEQVRARFEQASQEAPASGADSSHAQAARRRWAEALRTLYAARRNVGAYVRLAEETGVTAADCLAVAKMLSARRKPEEALAWVERGLALDAETRHGTAASRDLPKQRVRLLKKLGREDEAVEAVWAAFREHPGRTTYDDLLKAVPEPERPIWHERALDAARGADLGAHIALLVHVKDTERLAGLVRDSSDAALEGVSSHTSEQAATRLEPRHPEAAARLWRAQALIILNAKNPKAYPGALRSLERAQRCYEQAGRAGDWQQLVDAVRAAHHRKTSFMPSFEQLVSGVGPSEEPSFLDRARARWS